MSIALSLIPILGKPVAEKLIKTLGESSNGAQKFEQAAVAMAQGATAIEALKNAFGKDFLNSLNAVLVTNGRLVLTYQAGTQAYIKLDNVPTNKILKDELNINLDRLSVLDLRTPELTNMFRGLISVWHDRCAEVYTNETQIADIKSTFKTINSLLDGNFKNYREIYKVLNTTAVGGVGALMIIGGVLVATSTGVGVATAITTFLFGIPLTTVGALVLPGILLVMLAKKNSKPADVMSISIALLYKLLERLNGR